MSDASKEGLRPVRPCAWAHRYSPRGPLHTLRDNQQDADDDAAIVGGSAHVVALYDERALDEAVAAERERWTDSVSQAHRDRNNAAHVRDAALSALFEIERLAGHDDALTEWREKWAHLWALRVGPNVGGEVTATAQGNR